MSDSTAWFKVTANVHGYRVGNMVQLDCNCLGPVEKAAIKAGYLDRYYTEDELVEMVRDARDGELDEEE